MKKPKTKKKKHTNHQKHQTDPALLLRIAANRRARQIIEREKKMTENSNTQEDQRPIITYDAGRRIWLKWVEEERMRANHASSRLIQEYRVRSLKPSIGSGFYEKSSSVSANFLASHPEYKTRYIESTRPLANPPEIAAPVIQAKPERASNAPDPQKGAGPVFNDKTSIDGIRGIISLPFSDAEKLNLIRRLL